VAGIAVHLFLEVQIHVRERHGIEIVGACPVVHVDETTIPLAESLQEVRILIGFLAFEKPQDQQRGSRAPVEDEVDVRCEAKSATERSRVYKRKKRVQKRYVVRIVEDANRRVCHI
jgi:hypothetical protein